MQSKNTKTDCSNKKYLISEYQNHLLTKSNLHISIRQSQIKKLILTWWTL
jgi:hypothetical protein